MDARRGLCIRGKWIRRIRRVTLISLGQVRYANFSLRFLRLSRAQGSDALLLFFFGTATLVEGPDDAFMTYANSAAQFTVGAGCTFSESTLAICTIVAQSSTATQTDYISRVAIQGGATVSRDPSTTVSSTPSPSVGGDSSTSTLPSLSSAPPPNSTNSASSKPSKPLSRSSIASILALMTCAHCVAVFLA